MRKSNPVLKELIKETGWSYHVLSAKFAQYHDRFAKRVQTQYKLEEMPSLSTNVMAIWKWANRGVLPKNKYCRVGFCKFLSWVLRRPINPKSVFGKKAIEIEYDFDLDPEVPSAVFASRVWAGINDREKKEVWDHRDVKHRGYTAPDMSVSYSRTRKVFQYCRIRPFSNKYQDLTDEQYLYTKQVEASLIKVAREHYKNN